MSRGWAKHGLVEGFADPSVMSEEQLRAEVAALVRADEVSARRWACEVPYCDGLPHSGWLHHHARAAQRRPLWLWTVWMLLTGRGWGKSRTAAEAVRDWAQTPGQQIAVVAKNATLVRDICFESPKSGLLSVFPPEENVKYKSGLGETTNGESLDRLPMSKASFRIGADGTELNRLDLLIDFVPVVHIANTIPDGGEHWGRSVLARLLQALDELAATDSDSSAASATTGTPIIGLAGARLPLDRATGKPQELQVKAGAVWQLGETGRMDALDTSPQLAELRARVDHLLERIAANSRVTAAGLGTLDATEVPSGYASKLALGRWTG